MISSSLWLAFSRVRELKYVKSNTNNQFNIYINIFIIQPKKNP
jgi:hypothetical protein